MVTIGSSLRLASWTAQDALSKRQYRWLLGCIVVLALLLRLGLTHGTVGLHTPIDSVANYDGVEYETLAFHLAAGEGYVNEAGEATAIRPPGFPLLLAAVYSLFGRSMLAANLALVLLSAATCWSVAWATRQVAGPWVALLAAAWIAFYPGHFIYAARFRSEVVFAFLSPIAFGLSIAAYARGGKLVMEAMSGFLLGFSILIRPQLLFFFPFGWLAILSIRTLRRRDVLRPALVHSLMAAAVIVPWGLRNQAAVGKFTISTIGGYTFWGANNAVVAQDPGLSGYWIPVDSLIDESHPLEGTEAEREAATWKYGAEFLLENPGQIAPLLLTKLEGLLQLFPRGGSPVAAWFYALAWFVTGPSALLGLWWFSRHRPAAFLLLILNIAALIATTLLFYGSMRFRDSISSLFVIPAAVGALVVIDAFRQRQGVGAHVPSEPLDTNA